MSVTVGNPLAGPVAYPGAPVNPANPADPASTPALNPNTGQPDAAQGSNAAGGASALPSHVDPRFTQELAQPAPAANEQGNAPSESATPAEQDAPLAKVTDLASATENSLAAPLNEASQSVRTLLVNLTAKVYAGTISKDEFAQLEQAVKKLNAALPQAGVVEGMAVAEAEGLTKLAQDALSLVQRQAVGAGSLTPLLEAIKTLRDRVAGLPSPAQAGSVDAAQVALLSATYRQLETKVNQLMASGIKVPELGSYEDYKKLMQPIAQLLGQVEQRATLEQLRTAFPSAMDDLKRALGSLGTTLGGAAIDPEKLSQLQSLFYAMRSAGSSLHGHEIADATLQGRKQGLTKIDQTRAQQVVDQIDAANKEVGAALAQYGPALLAHHKQAVGDAAAALRKAVGVLKDVPAGQVASAEQAQAVKDAQKALQDALLLAKRSYGMHVYAMRSTDWAARRQSQKDWSFTTQSLGEKFDHKTLQMAATVALDVAAYAGERHEQKLALDAATEALKKALEALKTPNAPKDETQTGDATDAAHSPDPEKLLAVNRAYLELTELTTKWQRTYGTPGSGKSSIEEHLWFKGRNTMVGRNYGVFLPENPIYAKLYSGIRLSDMQSDMGLSVQDISAIMGDPSDPSQGVVVTAFNAAKAQLDSARTALVKDNHGLAEIYEDKLAAASEALAALTEKFNPPGGPVTEDPVKLEALKTALANFRKLSEEAYLTPRRLGLVSHQQSKNGSRIPGTETINTGDPAIPAGDWSLLTPERNPELGYGALIQATAIAIGTAKREQDKKTKGAQLDTSTQALQKAVSELKPTADGKSLTSESLNALGAAYRALETQRDAWIRAFNVDPQGRAVAAKTALESAKNALKPYGVEIGQIEKIDLTRALTGLTEAVELVAA